MHSINLIFAFQISIIIFATQFSESNAKAFVNPFNVAIKTKFTEDGNVFTFVYPKKSHQVSLRVNSEDINESNFDFSGFISFLLRKIGSKFNFFNIFKSSSESTTTERNFEFSNEVTDETDTGNESGEEEDKNSSKETSEAPEEDNKGGEDMDSNENTNNEYSSTTETGNIRYLPPDIVVPSSLYELPKFS